MGPGDLQLRKLESLLSCQNPTLGTYMTHLNREGEAN